MSYMAIHFDSSKLPVPTAEYVIWCDGMGTGTLLTRSLDGSANSVFRTHVAFERMKRKLASVRLYPVMDGLYATTPSRRDASTLLQGVFTQVARQFLSEDDPRHRSIIRAAIAYGPCIHGDDVPDAAYRSDAEDTFKLSAKGAILLSPAMPLAHDGERLAAPFGVAVDATATSMPVVVNAKDKGFSQFAFRWWQRLDEAGLTAILELHTKVLEHLRWVEKNSAVLGYPVEAAKRHQKLAEDYLPTRDALEKLAAERGENRAES